MIPSPRTTASRALQVALDTNALYVTRAGIARYVRGLSRGLAQSATAGAIAVTPLAWPIENFSFRQPGRALRTAYRELCWGRWLAPRALRAMGADLLHSTSSLYIRHPRRVRHLVTLHDLSVSRHPERFRAWQVATWRRRLPILRNADHILCVSAFTANEAMALLELPAKKLTVVHNGCDWQEAAALPVEQAPATPVPSEFFLFVGSLEPGKNLRLLRDVYLQAANEGRHLPPLLIVGVRWAGVATEGAQPPGWHYLGWQPDETLVYLYRRAQALVFPSIYEGFGLPLVEAMTLGCPVICSAVASLPEVAGDAALMGPLEPKWYLHAMREVPARRADLVARGYARARRFTWTRCAEETIAVYRQSMQG